MNMYVVAVPVCLGLASQINLSSALAEHAAPSSTTRRRRQQLKQREPHPSDVSASMPTTDVANDHLNAHTSTSDSHCCYDRRSTLETGISHLASSSAAAAAAAALFRTSPATAAAAARCEIDGHCDDAAARSTLPPISTTSRSAYRTSLPMPTWRDGQQSCRQTYGSSDRSIAQ